MGQRVGASSCAENRTNVVAKTMRRKERLDRLDKEHQQAKRRCIELAGSTVRVCVRGV